MESSELPEGWVRVPEGFGLSAGAIYRDAEAGRQVIELNNGLLELKLQGWEGTLAISEDLKEVLAIADRYRTFRSFRIANMTQEEISEYVMQATWMAVACLSDPTQQNIATARKAIGDVETLMTSLRVRCAQKDPAGPADVQVKADAYASELRYVTLALFRRMANGEMVDAADDYSSLEGILERIGDDLDDVWGSFHMGETDGAN